MPASSRRAVLNAPADPTSASTATRLRAVSYGASEPLFAT